jgi:hypothetical protein
MSRHKMRVRATTRGSCVPRSTLQIRRNVKLNTGSRHVSHAGVLRPWFGSHTSAPCLASSRDRGSLPSRKLRGDSAGPRRSFRANVCASRARKVYTKRLSCIACCAGDECSVQLAIAVSHEVSLALPPALHHLARDRLRSGTPRQFIERIYIMAKRARHNCVGSGATTTAR